jgi:hypothetical protein
MTIKDDLSKYPCFLYQMGTIRPIPEPTAWSSDLQLHHFVKQNVRKTDPKFYERVEHLQKLILMPSKMHYDLHAMGEDTFFKRYGIEKHKLLFNRKLWRANYYEQISTNDTATTTDL